MIKSKSAELFEKSKKIMPGGVNSPVRAFKNVGLTPPFIKKAKGSKLIDVEGNEYIDYVGSWGPMILGHAHDDIVSEIKIAAEDGTSFGAPTEKEYILGKLICDAISSIKKLRMVNSGTEAVMSAIRLARGFTKRDKILKFKGCYHGHYDGLLVKAGSGALTTGFPDSAGIPMDYAKYTLVGEYNNCSELSEIFKKYGDDIAAVIIEPVAANMGVVLPDIEFLKLARKLSEYHGSLLIFDEVITGFRVSYSGAQGYFGIDPDITVLGKVIGGGLPVGAYGGREEIMNMISPEGPVYQAGTLSGNPIAMSAGIKTLELLKETPGLYEELDRKANQLEKAFWDASQKYDIPIAVNRLGSLIGMFFNENKVTDYTAVIRSDIDRFVRYFRLMMENGIYLAPSQYEAMFVSYAHSDFDILRTSEAIKISFSKIK